MINLSFFTALLTICSCFIYVPQSDAKPPSLKCAILLHGLGRTHTSMSAVAALLKHEGYYVVNQSYPSTQKSIDALANEHIPMMLNACKEQQAKEIIFITHSLGGIILQAYLKERDIPELTHIVMLSPPNHGSPIVDRLHHYWFFQQILGPAGQMLYTQTHAKYALPNTRHYRTCIIAGNKSQPLLSQYFFGENTPNDGKVSVESAYLNHTDEFVIYPVSHTLMMNSKQVHEKIQSFLGKPSSSKV